MKNFDFATKKLMTPGPVPLPEVVQKAFSAYECHHRTPEFTEVLSQVFSDLKAVFQTTNHCYLLASTGTGALEASLVNCLGTDDHLLTINAGKFGERWKKLANAYGVPCTSLDFSWGEDIDVDRVRQELKKGNYTALAWQACETSTGALLPNQELVTLCKEVGVLSIVDAITALGAVDLPMDRWGIDVLVGGSQKAFMLPTGMSFISLSPLAESRQSDLPSFYFDLAAEKKANLSGKTRWSTPTHFVLGLHCVLDQILNQTGLSNHFTEIINRAELFRKEVGISLYPSTPSPSLSCLKMPENISGNKIKSLVAQEGWIIMGGQDQLDDKVLRVGHMGHISNADLVATAQAIKKHL